jgi:hypothetical protein
MGSDPASSPTQPPDDDSRTPFERFEDVLRKVVSVPKSEVDKRRQQHQTRHERPA